MGKHDLKRKTWKKINNQKNDGLFPEWLGWLFVVVVVIVFLVMSY
jgi:hypothetical protein